MEEPFYTQQLPENNQLDSIHKIISDKVVKYNFMISDLSLNNLTFHIYIAIQRILDGKVIPPLVKRQNSRWKMIVTLR